MDMDGSLHSQMQAWKVKQVGILLSGRKEASLPLKYYTTLYGNRICRWLSLARQDPDRPVGISVSSSF